MPATKRPMDFTNVKEGGVFNPRHVEPGDYRLKIVKVDDHTSQAGNDGWVFTLKRDGDERATYPYHCGADEKQAWKVRKLFIAAGLQVPKKRVMVDPNKLVNKTIGASLDDDEYEGRLKSVITDTFPADDVTESDDDDDEEVTPPPRKRAAKKTTAKKAAPADDEDDDADIDDLDLEEL
jgi:hypothetical protein